MKLRSVILLLLCPVLLLAQTEETPVKSEIKDVTVYTMGAQVSRTARVNLTKGTNILAFEELSPILDDKSLQFNAGNGITILSMNFAVRFDKTTQARKDRAAQLNSDLKALGEDLKTRKDFLEVAANEERVLIANTDFDVWKGMSVDQLKQGVDLVRNRLTQIKDRKRTIYKEVEEINLKRQSITNELQAMRIEDAKPKGVILVKLKSEFSRPVETEISYVVADAGWEPYYDLRVKDISSPLRIEYKARVRQNTGENWDQVNLVLSTGNPYEEGSLPELEAWYLNYVSGTYYRSYNKPVSPQTKGTTGVFRGVVIDASTGESIPIANVVGLDKSNSIVAGTTSDLDGNFALETNSPITKIQVSFTGYSTVSLNPLGTDNFYTVKLHESSDQLQEVVVVYERPLIDGSKSSKTFRREDYAPSNSGSVRNEGKRSKVITGGLPGQYGSAAGGIAQISRNSVNLKFEVDIPYDVPSNGEDYKVAITEYNKEVDYLYRAVPKLNEHAFLIASLVGWEDLKLMNGSAGIYFEDTYLGETFLNVEEAGDTLQMSLGKDENIKVLRTAVTQKEGSNFLGGKRVDRFHYEIKVRNNKEAPLSIEITDQYPISANEKIEVEREEHSGGKVNDDTGIITWEFVLPPREEKKLDLKYEIKYEKGKKVNIR